MFCLQMVSFKMAEFHVFGISCCHFWRQVVHPSLNGGRPCGALMEHKVCSQSCEAFHWVAGGWSECQLIAADRNRGCGTGDQYRQVR